MRPPTAKPTRRPTPREEHTALEADGQLALDFGGDERRLSITDLAALHRELRPRRRRRT